MPGARTHWHGRQWHWESWDGTGQHDRGTANKRIDAFARASNSVDEMAREHDVPREKIREASLERGAQTRAANTAGQEQTRVVDIAPSDQSAATYVEEPPTVDQSVIDAVKAAGGSHPRKLRDIVNNQTPDTEQGATANEPTPQVERDYGLDEDGERAV